MPGNGEFIPLAQILGKLGVILTFSLMVERFLAILNYLIDRLLAIKVSADWEGIKEKEAQLALTERAVEEEAVLAAPPPERDASTPPDPREIEPNPTAKDVAPDSRFDIKKATPPDLLKTTKEFWSQIFGTLVATLGCFYLKFSIFVFITWLKDRSVPIDTIQPEFWEYIFTGIIIGAGSKPVHFLMDFLIQRKLRVARQQPVAEAAPAGGAAGGVLVPLPAPRPAKPCTTLPKTIEEIVGFTYDGGDRPERLENTHLFKKPIDLIVFHHTAMHADSPFEEVVREFDRKGWLTGYNCVVLKDGTIRVLCRWDRFGNHVRGYNNHSLGVALHGNFETNPRVPFSNHDGRYGMLHPTMPQVDAAARVAALWALMHKIEVKFPPRDAADFDKGVVPHNHLAQKACPGNNFPYQTFRGLVTKYTDKWRADKEFKSALEDFMAMPRVMPILTT
ncbi:MAG: N-acetylmuramoyl-L-alanine amidase [Calditrichaeota bacterium]|nr:MAG: N-acetylmuramoyl-L-alanine amidase [Calditrichota bacterium]